MQFKNMFESRKFTLVVVALFAYLSLILLMIIIGRPNLHAAELGIGIAGIIAFYFGANVYQDKNEKEREKRKPISNEVDD